MFRVEWLQSALDELADVWMQADSPVRQAITAAAHCIELQESVAWRLATGRNNKGRCEFHFVKSKTVASSGGSS